MAEKSGTGQGGKSFQDRVLAGEVRSLALDKLKEILEGKGEYAEDINFKKAVILKLAGTVLPRLNEVGGRDGEPIQSSITVKFG